jgi:indole-3-glycerol phosphate synthase
MPDALASIYQDRLRHLTEEMARESLTELADRAQGQNGERRSLRDALRRGPAPTVIAEIKRASPSAGLIAPDFDPQAIALEYQQAGADAISVLTEADHFQGQLSYLQLVRDRTSLPLLRKDFLTTEYEVVQSAAYGADAILAIVAGLTDQQLAEVLGAARRWGVEVLVEVHSRGELERALAQGADLVGINNRDLNTLATDISVTAKLVADLPVGLAVVSESGFETAADIESIYRLGVRSFLVGEALMRCPDKAAWMASVKALGAVEA